jgi:hypothetical protein
MSSKENSVERPSDKSQNNGDTEKGKNGDEKPVVGIFSPQLGHVRREILWKWCLTTVTLMAFIMAILSICANQSSSLVE